MKWQVDGIKAALNDPLLGVRLEALRMVSHFSAAEGIPSSEIVKLLKDPVTDVRRSAAAALGVMQAKDQAPEIVKLLKDPDDLVRSFAADALGAMQAKDQAPEIAQLLKDPKDLVRSFAAAALGVMHAKEQAPEIFKLLKDPNPNVRSYAAGALGVMHAKEQAPEISKLLKDPNPNVRSYAAAALGAMQAKEQAPEIFKLLKDPDPNVSRFAAEALGAMQAKEQAPELVKLLKDRDPNVYSFAVVALGAMQAEDQAPELAKLLKDPDPNVRSFAALALGAVHAKDQAPEIVKLLNDTESSVRSRAALALGAMQAKEQAPEIAKLFKDPTDFVRRSAAAALGRMQAKGQAPEITQLLEDPEPSVRGFAADALGAMQAKEQAPEIAKLLKDPEPSVRRSAATALGAMQAKDQAPEIVKLLKDPNSDVRGSAQTALGAMGPLPPAITAQIAEVYYFNSSGQVTIRFLCYYLTGGAPEVALILQQVLFSPDQRPSDPPSLKEARETLKAFAAILPDKRIDSQFAAAADTRILQLANKWLGQWGADDQPLFASLGRKMDPNSATTLMSMIETRQWQKVLGCLGKIALMHALFWILLLFFYPTSRRVQAFLIWNKCAREVAGLGYVTFLLTWIPFLRNRLLSPFREELMRDARVGDETLDDYFEDVEALEVEKRKTTRLSEAINDVVGQIILEGESGLGKSMFLRRLVKEAKQPIAYLPADSCDAGVLEAIQLRLEGKARDNQFLKSIIWAGGLRIVIDGLNEVTVETREKIRRFLDESPKADVLLATQPIQWKRPPKARVFQIQKLSDDRILQFLESRYHSFAEPRPVQEEAYKTKCREYIESVLSPAQSEEDRTAARLVLSNPMDLSTVARILLDSRQPTLTNLQQQQFDQMKSRYLKTHPGEEFPLAAFSESVYERRVGGKLALDEEHFFEVIQPMVDYKMALERNDRDAAGKPTKKWFFRHDKIRDYFLMQAFLTKLDERMQKHTADSWFHGVYLMLAWHLPIEQATALRDRLVSLAATSKDHHLSDRVVQILQTRAAAPSAPPVPPDPDWQ